MIIKPYYLLLLSTFFCALLAGAQTKVEIIGGERMTVDQKKKETCIVENVMIRHDGVIIQCDSAIRKTDLGIIEGFGHIYIFQQDTFTLSGGEYLKYDEKTKTAIVTGKNVILADKEMTLLTTSLQYNIDRQIGYYTNGADILNEKNTLKSKRGYYNRRSNVFNFKEKVKLTSPDYTMEGDTLDYYAATKTAYFYGPTRIVSKENIIECRHGWYNTSTETAQFSKGATIFTGESSISADSLYYDKKLEYGRGTGNIKMHDSAENVEIYGQNGLYFGKTKESIISTRPMAVKMDEDDTFYLLADTLYFRNDSLNRILKAYYHTSLLQRDFQGKCDSLVYDFRDSSIRLFYAPILWSEKNQISGDTMRIQMVHKRIKTLKVMNNGFIASEVKPGNYNQISGKNMVNYFDNNKLASVHVEGNAQSIYYLRDNETDTAEYTGINKVACSRMLIGFDSGKVKGIRFFTQPEGKIYPVNAFPDTEKFLPGLDWKVEEKPVLSSFLERMIKVEWQVVPVNEKPVEIKSKKKKNKAAKIP